MFRLFPRTFAAGPDISTFFLRFSGFTQLILSLPHITLYILIKSPLSRLSFKVIKLYLYNLSSYSSLLNTNGVLVALLKTLSRFFQCLVASEYSKLVQRSQSVVLQEKHSDFSIASLLSNVLFNIPSILFDFATILFTCQLLLRSSLSFPLKSLSSLVLLYLIQDRSKTR